MGNDNPERELLLTVAEAVFAMQDQLEEAADNMLLLLARMDELEERLSGLEDEVQQ